EMLEVPDDAVKVDVFTHNTATGRLERTSFFTEADTPEETAARAKAMEAARNGPKTQAFAKYAADLINPPEKPQLGAEINMTPRVETKDAKS
ncbi:MAG: hypothetical protein KGL39_10560, partial [Patescibacteria group bacterium]|nr:hypothetical protein [Patescibacteria group bacterium]